MAEKKSGATYYPGVPEEVSPEDAKWLKENHPQYDQYKGVIKERLSAWHEKHPPEPAAAEEAKPAEAAAPARARSSADASKNKEG